MINQWGKYVYKGKLRKKECSKCGMYLEENYDNFSPIKTIEKDDEIEIVYFRPDCRDCRSMVNSQKSLLKRRAFDGYRYYMCNSCDHIWVRKLGKYCSQCGNLPIELYNPNNAIKIND